MYDRIENIQERAKVEKLDFYLTGKGNFREEIATILPYKGNRPEEKPPHWAALRHELVTNCGATVVDGMEADDAVSIIQWKDWEAYTDKLGEVPLNTAILSRDKDLNMVPGYHYGWAAGNCKEKPLWIQNEVDGLRCFYKQCITGDRQVDNIPGLFGVGPKSALVTQLDALYGDREMYDHVLSKYTDRFGGYAEKFLTENARLLHMLQYEGQLWLPPRRT